MAYSRQLTEKALLFRNHNKRAKIILNIEIVRFRAGLETPLLVSTWRIHGQGENAFGVVKDNRSVINHRLRGPKLIINVFSLRFFTHFWLILAFSYSIKLNYTAQNLTCT